MRQHSHSQEIESSVPLKKATRHVLGAGGGGAPAPSVTPVATWSPERNAVGHHAGNNWDSPMPHVDHCGNKEFRHIVADFEAQTDESDFAKYHETRAELQMLCENCNLKKPRRTS